ncbi:hypothetical protein GWI33_002277 [Rhynchophorus ferrugineus]|uniref:Uncharacterized protein n=1 Tax=Rhynchophorus ferrugineus TaxID=354439 RepID=A0A834IYN4_RHYFE|nr:hypothetical protein GWI33_002277 [Rhynchophorus ferrugineus]
MTSRLRSATPPPGVSCQCFHSTKERPKSLMESILVAKMEQVTLGQPGQGQSASKPPLIRTDSIDSSSSFGSANSFASSDICRCDDCLLGIADLYAQPEEGEKKKKR